MKTVVFSLGGSLIVPDDIDSDFLISFRKMIMDFISDGNRAVIVCGGGMLCRRYNDAAKKISDIKDEDLDWMGIAATKLNAELVRCIFSDVAHHEVIKDPGEPIDTDKPIVIGAGFRPGNSSDKVAVMLADQFKADTVINMTNISQVYTDDPKVNPDAEPVDDLSWDDFLGIIGEEWVPGRNVPFDPVASKLAKEKDITVIILSGNDLDNLKEMIAGRKFTGTRIRP